MTTRSGSALITGFTALSQCGTPVSYDPFDGSRYPFDGALCSDGWRTYHTDQDASYFGVWIHDLRRMVFTYCEGDLSLSVSSDDAQFGAELYSLDQFYKES